MCRSCSGHTIIMSSPELVSLSAREISEKSCRLRLKRETISREYKWIGILKVKRLMDRAAQTCIYGSMKGGKDEENPERWVHAPRTLPMITTSLSNNGSWGLTTRQRLSCLEENRSTNRVVPSAEKGLFNEIKQDQGRSKVANTLEQYTKLEQTVKGTATELIWRDVSIRILRGDGGRVNVIFI